MLQQLSNNRSLNRSNQRLNITLFTSGRFHLCDLAREFIANGHNATLYSLVPPWQTRRYHLPSSSAHWLARSVWPILLRMRWTRSVEKKRLLRNRLTVALDNAAAKKIQRCDVFIGMSGMSNVVASLAKELGAHVRIQRCSRHILSQKEILHGIPGAEQVSQFDIDRELKDYELADVIDVPATHCMESFLSRGFQEDRLFCNPFGVDLECFAASPCPALPVTFIMVGTWSLRKGCDLLTSAWRKLPGTRLLHVGPVGDLSLPQDDGFRHVDSVPQADLPAYYAQAHIMCMASREEGLAFVQPQALACGLKLVCTDRTGGADLKGFVEDPDSIVVVPANDEAAFVVAMDALRRQVQLPGSNARQMLSSRGRDELTWSAYARRYLASLISHHEASARA